MRGPFTTFLSLALAPLLSLLLLEVGLRHWSGLPELLETAGVGQVDHVKAQLLRARGGQHPVVVLGSSVGLFAVDPDLLSRQLGLQPGAALNLSTHAAAPQQLAMWLPSVEALEPEWVVLVLSPFSLRSDRPLEDLGLFHPVIAGELGIAGGVEDWARWASMLVDHRSLLRNRVFGALQTQRDPRDGPGIRGENWTSALQLVSRQVAGGRYDLEAGGAQGVLLFASRLRARGIHLLLVRAPVHPQLDVRAARRAEERLVRERNLELWIPEGPYPQASLADPFHLNHRGRDRLTRALAQYVRPR